jgi:outer membrane protein assembly factor BamB
VVYYGSGNYYVLALNANTGTLLWESGTNDIIQSSPVVANGVLYVTSTDYNLYAFSLPGH